MIFGSPHNLLHNFKHQAFLTKKEKEKVHCAAPAACLDPAQDGPRALSRADCARALSHAATDERALLVRIPPSSSETLTGRPHLSVSSPSRTTALPQLRRPLARSPAPARVRISSASLPRTDLYHLLALYRPLSIATASPADGRHGRLSAGHQDPVECKPTA